MPLPAQRIVGAIPTIELALKRGAKSVILMSHLGRPDGNPNPSMSLKPVAERLGELLKKPVTFLPQCVGAETEAACANPAAGSIIVLENLRFHVEEEGKGCIHEAGCPGEKCEKKAPSKGAACKKTKATEEQVKAFRASLSKLGDVYVNDAFGTAHRAHASTEGVTKYLSPSVSGYLLAKELEYLAGAVDEPVRPLAAIVGGSKVSSKITVLESLIKKCDKVIVGGGMTFTFLKAQGKNVGTSLVEDDFIQTAKDAMKLAEEKGCELIFPNEILVADAFDANANTQVVSSDAIPDGWMGLDNGPAATKMIQDKLADCKTVIWNGPMGVFEMDAFAKGTFAICDTLKELTEKGAITIIGGGDSVAAVEKAGLADAMSHISTGGGASLELLEGKVLPGVAALDEA